MTIACIGLILSILLLTYRSREEKESRKELIKTVKIYGGHMLENGYAQGQLDALKGINRIRMINDTTCVWESSPWGKNVRTLNDTIKDLVIVRE